MRNVRTGACADPTSNQYLTTSMREPRAAPRRPAALTLAAWRTPFASPPFRPPVVLSGAGSRVLSLRLTADSPLVVTGRHAGSATFIVDLVPSGLGSGTTDNLFNEIGSYVGQTAVAD